MKHSKSTGPLKAQTTTQIKLLENNLFDKLGIVSPQPRIQHGNNQYNMFSCPQDSLTDLIGRAKGITMTNQDKIQKAKKQIRRSQKDVVGTFLTGTGLYSIETKEEKLPEEDNVYAEQTDPNQMLKYLTKKDEFDDLAQLRRMIKQTDKNLTEYSQQVYRTKKNVISAADKFDSKMNFNLTCKFNSFAKPMKKSNSVKKPRYY